MAQYLLTVSSSQINNMKGWCKMSLRYSPGKLVATIFAVAVPIYSGCSLQSSSSEDSGYLMESESGDSKMGDGFAPGSEPTEGQEGNEEIDPGQLTAGEWRDLDNWEYWTELFDAQGESSWEQMETTWEYRTRTRIPVVVSNGSNPAVDVMLNLIDQATEKVVYTSRTDNRGRAELFTGLFSSTSGPYEIRATKGNASAAVQVSETTLTEAVEIELAAPAPPAVVDLMFVVDTTGSMCDELSYLQAELKNVIEKVHSSNQSGLSIRTSVNFYRDFQDEYVVRPFPFTTDVDTTMGKLAAQSCGGGGDYPEAVHSALQNALLEHQWSEQAVARLLFLVLDAPPHEEPAVKQSLHESTLRAAELGVRIIPVASSGVDKKTEFFLRFIDIATGGTYVFLTNHSGIGGDHIEPTIGQYEVEYLNDLLIRLINEAL